MVIKFTVLSESKSTITTGIYSYKLQVRYPFILKEYNHTLAYGNSGTAALSYCKSIITLLHL
jgi:hypothetical protein